MSLLPGSSPRLQIGYQQPQQQPQQVVRPPPKCAEVCLDLLTSEAVRFFSDKQYGPAAGAALQAVGFRVGRQLAERWDLAPHVAYPVPANSIRTRIQFA
jgi:hypothetical protein